MVQFRLRSDYQTEHSQACTIFVHAQNYSHIIQFSEYVYIFQHSENIAMQAMPAPDTEKQESIMLLS